MTGAVAGSQLPLRYREDIDWLRAIAVLSVVAFHFGMPAVYGGFVGVDVFFVISGYLITGIVQSELRSGTFSFTRFYERRLRRLLPALYVVVVLTAIPSFRYMLTFERSEFFRSVAAVVTFTSNFFFWYQTGYFDRAAVEKPLLHTWSLAVEEQFYLALPLLLLVLSRAVRRGRYTQPLVLGTLATGSFALSLWLMHTSRSAEAFFMSIPRAWEFLVGGVLATPGLPVLRKAPAQQIARGIGLALLAIPIFSLREGPGFPGVSALSPCIGAAIFIWSGIDAPTQKRARYSPLHVVRFFGKISYSLYLWHWPLFTFARFAKNGLVLDPLEKCVLTVITVAISYLSWRFVEEPFRRKSLVPTTSGAFRLAGAATLVLLSGSVAGTLMSRALSNTDQYAMRLEAYDNYDVGLIYRAGSCFRYDDGAFDEACLHLVEGKENVLLWGDSYAAQYYHGLSRSIDPRRVNLLQATRAACMPTFSASSQGASACQQFALNMAAYFEDHRPDVVIMSADWLEYARPPRFDGMIADIKETISRLNQSGVSVVLMGPGVQFKSRLPSMLMRARLRNVDPTPEEFELPPIFSLDQMMKAALPPQGNFSYVSVLDAVCPARQCPLTVDHDAPLAWDHAHLTAEGSVYAARRIARLLGLPGSLPGPGSLLGETQ